MFFSTLATFAQNIEDLELNFYGSFLHSEQVPNALFFFSDIEKNDSFELRKALRNHDIDTLVLSSRGGSVWEGLSMAGIIHDKKLTTYIPATAIDGEGNCASACSFMFFGGATRIAKGKLGVHQFYSGKPSSKDQIAKTEEIAQFTVSEIIGFLNEFETPPFVFEKMFQQTEMYYFSKPELEQIIRLGNYDISSHSTEINNFITDLNRALLADKSKAQSKEDKKIDPPPISTKSSKSLIISIQKELNRLNCNAGIPDGIIGKKTRAAFARWKQISRSSANTLVSESTLNSLESSQSRCRTSPTWDRLAINETMYGTATCTRNGQTKKFKLKVTNAITKGKNKSLILNQKYLFDGHTHNNTFKCFPNKSCYGKFTHDQKDGYIQLNRNSITFTNNNIPGRGKCILKAE